MYTLQILSRVSSNLVCKVMYMEGIKYVNLIEIGPVVIEIRGTENGDLVVPVNNTCTCVPHVFLGCSHTTVCFDANEHDS